MIPRQPLKQPSQFQLALALAVVKSKPASITVREYVTKFRQHLAQGKAEQDHGSREKYLDAAGYWHSQYQESQREIDHLQTSNSVIEREKVKLEAEIAKLRLESVEAQAPVQPDRPSTAQAKSSAKRKKPPSKNVVVLQYKKLKTGNEVVPVMNGADLTIMDELTAFEESTGLDAAITRHLYSIHKLYQRISPDAPTLAHHLVQAARAIADHVATTAIEVQNQLYKVSLIKDKRLRAQHTTTIFTTLSRDFKGIQRAAVRSFTSLFQGLKTLWDSATESGRRSHGTATYEMICAMDTLLTAIEVTCHTRAKITTNDEAVPVDNDTASDPRKKYTFRRIDQALVPQEVTTVLLTMLSGLTASRTGPHTALFEGYLYLLLDRTAKKLFLLTFRHPHGVSIEDDIARGNKEPIQKDDVVFKAAVLEAQFLVQLTDRAMRLAPAFLGSLSSSTVTNATKAGRPGTATRSNAKANHQRPTISIAAKEMLQHTLIRCMFGESPRPLDDENDETEDEDGGNNEFIDVLKKPVQMGPVPPPPKVEDVDTPQWFREEMWRLIGWDILSREDGW